ncbi:MAG: TonB-dependent receptor, partial [Ferruginibacter sp.]
MQKLHTLMGLFLFGILFPLFVNAQATLSGTVKSNGVALPGASISATPSGKGTTAGEEGKYSLSLPAGSYVVRYSYAGYLTQTETVQLMEGEQKTVDADLPEDAKSLVDVVMVGSRSLPRTLVSSPLPVDVLSSEDLKSTGQISFDKQMQYRVPSFNTVNTPVNDATTLLDPYEIRNLGPSRTLVLINGKRKNLSSLLYVQFAPGRGETGADLSAIPVDAIKRVEILRDGASAQYGSDAIAGVMN